MARCERIRCKRLTVVPHELAVNAYGIWVSMPRMIALAKLPTTLLADMLDLRSLVAVRPDGPRTSISIVGGFEALCLVAHLSVRQELPASVLVSWIENDPATIKRVVNAELTLCLASVAHMRSAAGGLIALARAVDTVTSAKVWGRPNLTLSMLSDVSGIKIARFNAAVAAQKPSKTSILQRIIARGTAARGEREDEDVPRVWQLGDDLFGHANEDI